MKKLLYFLLSLLFVPIMFALLLMTYHTTFGGTQQGIYPNPKLTPGWPETLDPFNLREAFWCNNHQIGDGPACQQTYSQAHRNVSDATKRRVYQAYGLSYPQPAGAYEVDHFYPLCAGGSNDPKNLWTEPAHVMVKGRDYGFHTKDQLEAAVCWGIKQGTIDPHQAYLRITKDWVSYYDEVVGSGKFGGFPVDDMDGDTE